MSALPARYVPLDQMSGGMGTVLICDDSVLERKVAIKFIQAQEEPRRLIDELNALMKVRSKHVVQVYDVVDDGDRGLGIVQEYIDGPDLITSYSPPSTPREYYLKIWQIASGIADMHEVNIIHRDIKPNNMKIDHEGVIKIFDFGLAKNTSGEASTMGFIGTHGFSAPELYDDNPVFTTSVDVYAFGATALFLGTGGLPREVAQSYSNPVPDYLFTSFHFGISGEIARLLQATLSHSPADRPTMRVVKEALEKYILHGQHQALVVHKDKSTHLNSRRSNITLSVEGVGILEVVYDGMDFIIEKAEGEVSMNNAAVLAGALIPESCVLAIGGNHRKPWERSFITFDLSHPEINL
ncbi:serine/threonine protein kinase [Marinobacter sp.]|uniref:serine/threonine protein kinase n=1 Tax=Pseudomonadales TaxID=72274 RepID=UPI003A8FACA8